MATKETTTKKKKPTKAPQIKDEDNPSLIRVGGKLCLRVFEDFFVEKELPKWKEFKRRKKALLEETKMSSLEDLHYLERRQKDGSLNEEQIKAIKKQVEQLQEMAKTLEDDKWGIQTKHEKEVKEALGNMVVYYSFKPTTLMGKLHQWLDGFKKKPLLTPIEVAFKDLKEHMEMTTSEEVSRAKGMLESLVKDYEDSGQYVKAESARKLIPQLAHELAIANVGYTKYVSEKQMVDFVKKSEKGVMVNFLRYYEGSIPKDVVAKKNAADAHMIFDNYVIAYYGDFAVEAKKAVAKEKEETKEKATARRRDPILFGMIKQTRKLYYICDWATPEDDLTLEKLEKVLGESVDKLFSLRGTKEDNDAARTTVSAGERTIINDIDTEEYRRMERLYYPSGDMIYTEPPLLRRNTYRPDY